MKRLLVPVLVATVWCLRADPGLARSNDVDLGGLVLSISTSRTAQLFHIVDQLSQWDPYAHKQYARWADRTLSMDAEDRGLLERHASMRRARGWGKGFEQAFLVDASIDDAAAAAVGAGLLSTDEASAERAILRHFAPKLSELIDRRAEEQSAFAGRLRADRDRLRALIRELTRFAEASRPDTVPVFLVANPDSENGGGEANGGRLVIEVPGPGTEEIALHESLHWLLVPHADAIRAAADSCGLTFEQMNEGIAYALSPGLTDDPARRDRLVEELTIRVLRGTAGTDPYARFYMVAGVIRPLLRSALAHGDTITEFLPRAVAAWRGTAPRQRR